MKYNKNNNKINKFNNYKQLINSLSQFNLNPNLYKYIQKLMTRKGRVRILFKD
jgi:hypothetical protein